VDASRRHHLKGFTVSHRPNLARRIWVRFRDVLSLLFGSDEAESDRFTRRGHVHPHQEEQGRTFQGGLS
jgi:hypothetical protein